jgi:uncharacterized damage-inducible protein DinB
MSDLIMSFFKILKLNTNLFNNCLDGVSDEIARMRVSNNTNNIAFIAVHVVDARYYLADYLGLTAENPFKDFADIQSIKDVIDFPAVDTLRSAWQTVSAALEKRFQVLTESELKAKSPEKFPLDDDTVLGGIAFMLQHESFHIGQLAFLRKHFGLGPMKY